MTESAAPTATTAAIPDPRRWVALWVLSSVQLMLILDTTVVNVALPAIRDALGFSSTGLVWVVNGYALASGGLLVLGGRLGDLLGRRRVFLSGVAVFAVASLACAAAQEAWQLVVGRFGQGVGTALATPTALALVSLLFPAARERARALAIWGGLTGIGGAAGVLLSGALTDLAGWRWIFLINIPIAIVSLVLVPRLVRAAEPADGSRRLDLPGAALVTVGLVLVIDGLLRAGDDGWVSGAVLARLVGGAMLLIAFVAVESRTAEPLTPLVFFRHRTRLAAYAATAISATSMASVFFFLTLYLQGVLGWSAFQTGLAWTPFGFAMLGGVTLAGMGTHRIGLRWMLALGFTTSAGGLLVLTRLGTTASFAVEVLPAMLLIAFGLGVCLPVIQGAALAGTSDRDAGLASGVHATLSNLAGSVGLAVFVAVTAERMRSGVASGEPLPVATTAGYTLAWLVGAAALLTGAVLGVVFVRGRSTPRPPAVDSRETR